MRAACYAHSCSCLKRSNCARRGSYAALLLEPAPRPRGGGAAPSPPPGGSFRKQKQLRRRPTNTATHTHKHNTNTIQTAPNAAKNAAGATYATLYDGLKARADASMVKQVVDANPAIAAYLKNPATAITVFVPSNAVG